MHVRATSGHARDAGVQSTCLDFDQNLLFHTIAPGVRGFSFSVASAEIELTLAY